MKPADENKPGTIKIIAAITIALVMTVILVLIVGLGGRAFIDSIKSVKTERNYRVLPRTPDPMGEYTSSFLKSQIKTGNKIYTYYWQEPSQPWPEGVFFPLVLFLHGATGNAYGAYHLATEEMSYKYPAFILVPVLGQGTYWAMPPKISGDPGPALPAQYALNDIVDMIEQLSTQYPIDPKRIYVAGCSDGGTGVFGAAEYFPDIFAAGLAFSGSWDPEEGVNMTKMPLWIMHGALDSVIPADQTQALAEIINSRGGKAHYSLFERLQHDCASPFFYQEATWRWMFQQRLP